MKRSVFLATVVVVGGIVVWCNISTGHRGGGEESPRKQQPAVLREANEAAESGTGSAASLAIGDAATQRLREIASYDRRHTRRLELYNFMVGGDYRHLAAANLEFLMEELESVYFGDPSIEHAIRAVRVEQAKRGIEEALDWLTEQSLNDDYRIAAIAISDLARVGSPQAVEQLVTVLNDKSGSVASGDVVYASPRMLAASELRELFPSSPLSGAPITEERIRKFKEWWVSTQ